MKKSALFYVEDKSAGLSGPARITRLRFSKSGGSLYGLTRTFRSLKGRGYKANHFDVETGEQFWISHPKKDGGDALYDATVAVDADIRAEYWTRVRGRPDRVAELQYRSRGTYRR